tara:strand:+ start:1442 stop:2017 length:576 start_codon:yes stop_codon:yes gene_type:complete
MKINNLIKTIPIFSTLLLIVFLSISNQKEYTKLRILIWNTPSLTLGTYLSLSIGSGYIISYYFTNKLSRLNSSSRKPPLKFKTENEKNKISEYNELNEDSIYEKTLIERDLKDPLPTIDANFRIIGRKERSNINFTNNIHTQYNDSIEINEQYNDSIESDKQYNEELEVNENFNEEISISNDWNDQSYSKW